MRAILRGSKVILKNEDRKEIEDQITCISKEFEKLRRCCEDRSLETFPVDVVRKIVENSNKLNKLGRNIELNEKYLDYVIENKEALGFFQSQIDEYNEQISNFNSKIDILKKYASRIEDEILNIEEHKDFTIDI